MENSQEFWVKSWSVFRRAEDTSVKLKVDAKDGRYTTLRMDSVTARKLGKSVIKHASAKENLEGYDYSFVFMENLQGGDEFSSGQESEWRKVNDVLHRENHPAMFATTYISDDSLSVVQSQPGQVVRVRTKKSSKSPVDEVIIR